MVAGRLPKRRRCPMQNETNWFNRLALAIAGMLGAGGTAAAAAASHTSGDETLLGAVALFALGHAGVFLAFGLSSVGGRFLRFGALVLGAGVAVFCIDLAIRGVFDITLLAGTAPFGGMAMIAGWTLIAIAGAIGWRQ